MDLSVCAVRFKELHVVLLVTVLCSAAPSDVTI